MQSVRLSLVSIAAAVRDIVVEILFRDLEYLVDKYMTDMRKVSFIVLVYNRAGDGAGDFGDHHSFFIWYAYILYHCFIYYFWGS